MRTTNRGQTTTGSLAYKGIGVAATMAAATLTGCTAVAEQSAPAAVQGGAAPVARELSGAQLTTIARAEQVLIDGCMEARGFQYFANPPKPDANADAQESPYGSDDPVHAARYGFGTTPDDTTAWQAGARDPGARYVAGLSAGRRSAYTAARSPSSSCTATSPPGPGLVLQPSFFAYDDVTVLQVPDQPLVLAYPVRHRLDWCSARTDDPDRPPHQQLEALIGRTRSQALKVLVAGERTTTDLAGCLGVSLASASQQTRILREAGLIVSDQQGKTVLHRASTLGHTLLNGAVSR